MFQRFSLRDSKRRNSVRPNVEYLEKRDLMAVDFAIAPQPFDVRGVNGYSDVVVLDIDGDNRLFVDGVSGSKNPVTNVIDPRAINGSYTRLVSGDFDNDGKHDDLFFWRPVDGDSRIMLRTNQGTWDVLTDNPGRGAINGYAQFVAGDFDGDGRVNDLFFWLPGSGSSRMLIGAGRGHWQVVTEAINPKSIGSNRTAFGNSKTSFDVVDRTAAPGHVNWYTEINVGDFDSDGRNNDLMFRESNSGETRLLFGGGRGQWTVLTRPIEAGSANGYGRSLVGDLDGDGAARR